MWLLFSSLMDCLTPKITTPTVKKSGFRSRYAVQEFYEEIDGSPDFKNFTFSVPETVLDYPNKDFGWFLGVGTLPVQLFKKNFTKGFCSALNKIEVFTYGQYEVLIKPGKFLRSPIEFIYVKEVIELGERIPAIFGFPLYLQNPESPTTINFINTSLALFADFPYPYYNQKVIVASYESYAWIQKVFNPSMTVFNYSQKLVPPIYYRQVN